MRGYRTGIEQARVWIAAGGSSNPGKAPVPCRAQLSPQGHYEDQINTPREIGKNKSRRNLKSALRSSQEALHWGFRHVKTESSIARNPAARLNEVRECHPLGITHG